MSTSSVETALDHRSRWSGCKLFFVSLWSAYLIGNAFYVFPSGSPQPADFIAAVLILLVFSGLFIKIPKYDGIYIYGVLFILWCLLINWIYFFKYQELIFIITPIYYTYNFCFLIAIASLAKQYGEDFFRATRFCLIGSLVLELGFIIITSDGSWRNTGTFQNPNQFGYWSVILIACWLVSKDNNKIDIKDFFMLALSFYLISLSLSRAAIVSSFVLIFFVIILHRFNRKTLTIFSFLIVIVILLNPNIMKQMLTSTVEEGIGSNVAKRFEQGGSTDSSEGRGYNRITMFPEYLFFGAGEGAWHRFKVPGSSAELHSSWGTILFSYGIVGFAFFVGILREVFRGAEMRHYSYFIPIILYGLTHQGLRFSLLWVLLGLTFARLRWAQS